MSSAADNPAPLPPAAPAPSVFISYASEDRVAARQLRDTLSAAGLEVWYDEQELTGGDAWDQKIRRQIRDCDFFMPIISATTEARKEGYFRREWRLACERSLDMADDVLFIVPISIDETSEQGARVPDKFLTVQWLRAPKGAATPALHHLMRRLLAGDHRAAPRPPTRAPFQRTQAPFGTPPPLTSEPPPLDPAPASAQNQNTPPPMPPFPHPPEKGGFFHGIKFIAESFWWLLTATWILFKRLPRWGRVLITIWLIFVVIPSIKCSRDNNIKVGDRERTDRSDRSDRSPPVPPTVTRDATTHDADTDAKEARDAIKTAMEKYAQAAREARKSGNTNTADLANLGAEIAKHFSGGTPGAPEGAAMGKPLVLAPFARFNSEDPADKFASAVFSSLYGRLELTHSREVGLLRQAQGAAGDTALLARTKVLGSAYVLTGRLVTGEADARALVVRLLATEDGSTKWTDTFPVVGSEPSEVSDKIAENVLSVLPHRDAPPKKSAN